MASTLSLYLMCPVCLSDFNDPVSLPCEHVFCRQCITSYLELHEGAHKCPECRQNFTRQDLKGNRVLRNVVDILQQQNAQEMLCSEHLEPLKLFCENDQRLVCLICKEGEKHRGKVTIYTFCHESGPQTFLFIDSRTTHCCTSPRTFFAKC
uniref:RING-type domain-containing protein n=1 Tax=Sinocyclocheilus grahami TaxID=75366 RepID=A0A672KTT9_SINGR